MAPHGPWCIPTPKWGELRGDVCADKPAGAIQKNLPGRGYPRDVPERPAPDVDERFSLHPADAEDALKALLQEGDKPKGKGGRKRPRPRPAR
jgi:hypothetical protein